MYKFELGNGNVISNVKINGGECSTEQEINEQTFEFGLTHFRLTKTSNDPEDEFCFMPEGDYDMMKLAYVYPDRWEKGTYKFAVNPISEAELKDMKTEARISYLEMLTEEENS